MEGFPAVGAFLLLRLRPRCQELWEPKEPREPKEYADVLDLDVWALLMVEAQRDLPEPSSVNGWL